MTPLQPQKKRAAGRPKENNLLRELKVKTWFNAVAEASGKTAYELEKEFSPSYVDRDKFHKQRSRLWEKYRTGKIVPTMKEREGGRRPVALLVEEKYPGTLKWLTSPIWTLADPDAEITMDYLRSVYESLVPDVQSILIEPQDVCASGFWRRQSDDFQLQLDAIVSIKHIDGITALIGLLRESFICQQKDRYEQVENTLKGLKLKNNREFIGVDESLRNHIAEWLKFGLFRYKMRV